MATIPSSRRRSTALAACIALVGGSGCLFGYTFLSHHWSAQAAANGIVMHLQLGASGNSLSDGSSSWDKAVEGALATWNAYLTDAEFFKGDPTIPIAANDGKNSVFWSSSVFGDSFGSALAVTTMWTQNGYRTEADVVFDNSKSWNSYRGNAWSNGVKDIRRVALHEFGHVLGLGHPDEDGQNVTAIMNSEIGNLYYLTSDDIAGARALWWTYRITDIRILGKPRAKIKRRRARVVCGVGNYSSWDTGSGSGVSKGALKVVLWLSKRRYPSRGYRVAEARFDLGANESRVFSLSGRANLPRRGRYWHTVVIEEYTANGWRAKAWRKLGKVRIRR